VKGHYGQYARGRDRIAAGFHHLIADRVVGYLPLGQQLGQERKVAVSLSCWGSQDESRGDVPLERIA
jgi:hypothetical protein